MIPVMTQISAVFHKYAKLKTNVCTSKGKQIRPPLIKVIYKEVPERQLQLTCQQSQAPLTASNVLNNTGVIMKERKISFNTNPGFVVDIGTILVSAEVYNSCQQFECVKIIL